MVVHDRHSSCQGHAEDPAAGRQWQREALEAEEDPHERYSEEHRLHLCIMPVQFPEDHERVSQREVG